MQPSTIEEKLKNLPSSPGVYIMRGRNNAVLYIGKAKDIKDRVRSYFRNTADSRYAVRFLASKVSDIDYIVTSNEKEALLLEDTLIKQHKPKYNISLKDSKTYVSIKLTLNEKFPRILVVRQIKKDGARYFGPYVSASVVRDTVKLIRRIFPLCVCSPAVFNNRSRPCLDFQLGLCPAPAVGLITEDAYKELVDSAIMFLEGRNDALIKSLKEQMRSASAALDFEKAAKLRDRISAIEEMLERQQVVSMNRIDRDVFALTRDSGTLALQGLFIRDGRLVNSRAYFFEDAGLPDDEVMSSFIAEYYRQGREIPDEVISSGARNDDMALTSEWLSEKAGKKVDAIVPSRGERRSLVNMAEANAFEALKKKAAEHEKTASSLIELQKRLGLKNLPESIEAIDISNISGKFAVGGLVAFKNGEPFKDGYRRFRIKSTQGPDDYAMMAEVMTRRYGRPDAGLPDLILVDGGKGQLNIALTVLKELGVKAVDVISLAKDKNEKEKIIYKNIKGERVYLPNVKDPVVLKEGSGPDLLLRRIRDEVHRFAISYHRKVKTKSDFTSALDEIPGIGPKLKKTLLEGFGSIEGIRTATVEELEKVPGVSRKIAERVKAG